MTRKVVLAFDLFGTLVDTSSISMVFRNCRTNDPETFDTMVTSTWRTLQLEFTWKFNSMGKKSNSQPFKKARTEIGILNIAEKYVTMDENTWCFSNGTPNMVEAAISSSELLSTTFVKDGKKRYISVDAIKVFKPSPKNYKYVLEKVGKDTGKDVFLVSGNPFDISGAKNAGLGTIWVIRSVNWGLDG
ncbi:HAD-like domain-containing protein [Terfezia claveryi]|nr:HAD-like domain-containing protein [Terfezia claveryi]